MYSMKLAVLPTSCAMSCTVSTYAPVNFRPSLCPVRRAFPPPDRGCFVRVLALTEDITHHTEATDIKHSALRNSCCHTASPIYSTCEHLSKARSFSSSLQSRTTAVSTRHTTGSRDCLGIVFQDLEEASIIPVVQQQ